MAPDPVKHAVRVRFTAVGGWAGGPLTPKSTLLGCALRVWMGGRVPQKLKERIQTAPLWFYNLRITSSYAQLYAIKCDSNPTDCSFAADEAMEIHPDEVHFNQAKEATADMVLREMHEHVCVWVLCQLG